MIIRKFNVEEKPALVAFWKRVFPDDPPHNAPSSVIDEKLTVDDLIFVVEEDNKIIGACMAGYDGHRGWLYAVGVSPDCRRQGVGSALVTHACRSLAEIGCTKVNLQIRSTNTQVASFYQALGFDIEDRLSMSAFVK